jgi:multiple sugar transport system substrate-binding protein
MLSRVRLARGNVLVLCLVLLSLVSLAACGTGTSNGSTNCSNIQLSYWNGLTGPDGPTMASIVAQFNASHSSIKVKMTIANNMSTKLDTAAASDTLPDVAIINEDQIATATFRGITRPMDDLLSQVSLSSSDFPQAAWDQATFAGHQYGVPLSFVALTMYYNADLFSKAGISAPPTSATDFASDAAALTTGGHHGFQITAGFPVAQIFQMLLHQFGGTEFSSDHTQATWNSQAGVQALQWMKDAQSKYSQPKLEVDADVNSFKTGTVGMIWNGIWQTSNLTGDAVSFSGKAAAPPQIGPNPGVWAGATYLTTPYHKVAQSACTVSAEGTFIKYLIDNSLTWAKAGNVPAYNKVRNSSDLQALTPQNVLASVLAHPVMAPPLPGVADDLTPMDNAVGAIMAGTATDIQKTLDDSVQQANKVLQQNQQKYGNTPPHV